MADNNDKITPEKLQQLQQLQQILMQQKGDPGTINQMPTGSLAPKAPSKLTPKGMLIAIIQGMQNSVKFVDQFINLVVKEDGGNANDVVKSARSPILFGVFVTVFFVILGSIWAAVAPLDSAAVAMGTVVSSTQKKVINHQEGGVLKAVFVKLGDVVKEGDKLIELDDSRIKSEYENVLNQYRTLLATERRLLAEINNDKEIAYPEFLIKDKSESDVAKIIETQNSLFESKSRILLAEKDSLRQKTKQLDKQIEGLEAKKVALQKTLEVTLDRLDATKKLNAKGFIQKAVLLEFEAKEASIQSEIAMTDTEVAKSEQEITRTDIELLNLDSKSSAQILSELKETQAQLAGHRERFFHLQELLARVILKSPVDGVVNNINFHTIGSSVPPGQTVVEISPVNDLLIIEAKVDPKTIDSIRVGLISKIRFSAFKSRTTPSFTGKVISLSPDLIVDHQRGPGDPLAGGYYLARIEIDMDKFKEIAESRKLELHPGMNAEVQIVTGTRTLLRYLLDPVIDAMFKGFKEK
jgi:HlyD family secretion protein